MKTDYKALVADATTLLRDSEIGSRVERNNMIGHLVDAVEELSAALAERRITDRETLFRAIAETGYTLSPAHSLLLADAILALPSTPITSTREALAQVLDIELASDENWERPRSGLGLTVGTTTRLADALLASGLVKDNRDSGLSPERRDARQRVDAALAELSAPVDRLAVIREVMAYMDQVEAPRVAIKIGQHFGVAPVEEEA